MVAVLWVLLFAVLVTGPALEYRRLAQGLAVCLWAATVVLTVYDNAPAGFPEEAQLLISLAAVPLAGLAAARLARPVLTPEPY